MKKNLVCLAFAIVFSCAVSGSVLGTGGGTEVTQIANNVQLTLQYEQQVQGYIRQGLQYENQIKNLIQNPASLLGADIGGIINGVGSIMSAGNSIGGGMAQIDKNFASTFKSPTAATLSQNFTHWHSASTGTLEAAMKSAGLNRDSRLSDADNLTSLYNQSQNSVGAVQATQQLSAINAAQVQQLMKLQDLLATQNIAASTYMAAQTAKNEAQNQDTDAVKRSLLAPKQPAQNIDTSSAPAKKWNLY